MRIRKGKRRKIEIRKDTKENTHNTDRFRKKRCRFTSASVKNGCKRECIMSYWQINWHRGTTWPYRLICIFRCILVYPFADSCLSYALLVVFSPYLIFDYSLYLSFFFYTSLLILFLFHSFHLIPLPSHPYSSSSISPFSSSISPLLPRSFLSRTVKWFAVFTEIYSTL